MMRGKSSSSLQKTYDECYLTCSTAVYFESQGNEAEALRSWRAALDAIYYHNAKMPTNFVPKSETEKALRDSLRDMENQCKERVDLLEALKLSRTEASASSTDKDGSGGSGNASSSTLTGVSKLLKPSPRASSESEAANTTSVPRSVGEGTIPAINYSDLSRPDLRSSSSSYSSRPFAPSRNSSERAVVGRRDTSVGSMSTSNHMDAALKAARNPGIGLDLPPLQLPPRTLPATSSASGSRKKSSRSPSPHKERTMLTTLRFGRGEKRPAKPAQRNSGSRPEETVGGKAATLAWNALKKKTAPDNGGMPLEVAASSAALDASRKTSLPLSERSSPENQYYDSQTRRLVSGNAPYKGRSSSDVPVRGDFGKQRPSSYPFPGQEDLRRPLYTENRGDANALTGSSLLSGFAVNDETGGSNDAGQGRFTPNSDPETGTNKLRRKPVAPPPPPGHFEPATYPTYMREYPETQSRKAAIERQSVLPLRNHSPAKIERRERERVSYSRHAMNTSSPRKNSMDERDATGRRQARVAAHAVRDRDAGNGDDEQSSTSYDERNSAALMRRKKRAQRPPKQGEDPILAGISDENKSDTESEKDEEKDEWAKKVKHLMKHLPRGCDEQAAKQIFNDIVVKGDEVHWDDVAGLEPAKNALKEAVVYPFLRPDLFMGLREPARGMLLFGPPGTGKTMLARAVATESKSTFFGVSASSLTSKYLGESEKLVKALFLIAKRMAPSIIFVDEIDSLLGSRGGGGEHEATRRIKTEFLIQWSDLQRAAAGREQSDKDKEKGDASRVLVLAATNMPWAIDDAARRRFVRRQYIPLPERETRAVQLKTLLGHQKHSLSEEEFAKLVDMTDGFSGSDITALAKDAAMGPLRSLGEALLHMTMDEIRPIGLEDFERSMENIRPSVSKVGLKEYEDWAGEFGERGG